MLTLSLNISLSIPIGRPDVRRLASCDHVLFRPNYAHLPWHYWSSRVREPMVGTPMHRIGLQEWSQQKMEQKRHYVKEMQDWRD